MRTSNDVDYSAASEREPGELTQYIQRITSSESEPVADGFPGRDLDSFSKPIASSVRSDWNPEAPTLPNATRILKPEDFDQTSQAKAQEMPGYTEIVSSPKPRPLPESRSTSTLPVVESGASLTTVGILLAATVLWIHLEAILAILLTRR